MTNNIERRIASALGSNTVRSAGIVALIDETQEAIAVAETVAEKTRVRGLDPNLSPDAVKAREDIQSADFSCARLKTLLPRLCERLDKVRAQEQVDAWKPRHQAAKSKRDALAKQLAETYPKMVAEFVRLFEAIEAADTEIRKVNASRPPGINAVGLSTVEEAAAPGRRHSVLATLVLPAWTEGSNVEWPAFRPPASALMMASMQPFFDRRILDGKWYETVAERDEKIKAEYAAMADLEAADVKARLDRQEVENAQVRSWRAAGY